jgi:PAS domain S-box-containing protein
MPIKRKVTLVILLSCFEVLLLACAFLISYQIYYYRRAVMRDTTVLTEVLAKNVKSAVAYQDQRAVGEILRTMEAEPHVDSAGVYGRENTLIAVYSKPGSGRTFPPHAPTEGTRFESGILVAVQPVLLNGKRVGSLLLRNNLQGLKDRIKMLGIVSLVVLLGSGGLTLILAAPLQKTISQPITSLTAAVQEVTGRKNYVVRLPILAEDEMGQLTLAFNQMLAGIEERDTALSTANESLRHSEAQLQTVVENLSDGLVVSDLEGNLLQFNRAALELHGFSSMAECRKNFRALVDRFELTDLDGNVLPLEQWPLPRILRGESLSNLEINVRQLPDGLTRVFNYGGTVVRNAQGASLLGVVTMRDITERKNAEKKATDQMARLALLNQITRATGERLDLQSIFQVVVRTLESQLPADFCCVCLYDAENKSLSVDCIGVNSEELGTALAMNRAAVLPIGHNGLSQCVSGVLVYEPEVTTSDQPFPQRLAKAGLKAFVAAPLWVESQCFGVLLVARKAARSFSSAECEFLRQLSEHVALSAHQAQLHAALQQAYDELRQTQQTAMQQERLRALGQMASGIAHDINNAVSPIALYTESLLETEPNLSDRARQYLQTMQGAIEDVGQTVTRMREFYREKEPQLMLLPVTLNNVARQVLELSKARWRDMAQQRGAHIEVKTEFAPDLPEIIGVESEIREALLNLVLNAVDAMPEGGTMTFRTGLCVDGEENNGQSRPRVVVEIADTGMGMDEDTRRRCLEPFFTTKGERGTGLGLAMVYGIARRHGAEIKIESAPGRGTTIGLAFRQPTETPHSAAPQSFSAPRSRYRILIVDDDPLLLKSLRDTLESDGHLVMAAHGGQAGVDVFRAAMARKEEFDAVITDLGMPYVDGRRVAAMIKEASPSTPVILLTGWGQRLIADNDIPPHVDQVLNKPPRLRELRNALALCIEEPHAKTV